MNTAHSQVLSRISRMLLAALCVAFAWLVLSLAFGIASSDARADDGGFADDLRSALEGVTSSAAGVVDATTSSAVHVVAPAVEDAAPPAPAHPTAPAVQTVVSRLADVAATGVATPIVGGVTATVGAIPIVGDATAALSVDGAVGAVGASVDVLLAGTARAAADALTGVLDPLTGLARGIPPQGIPDVVPPHGVTAMHTDAALGPQEAQARAVALTAAATWASLALPGASASATEPAVGGFGVLAHLRPVLQADSALTGPGGAGLGAWVLVALGPVVAYRAWMRRSGLENDEAPPAPMLSTDVSPD